MDRYYGIFPHIPDQLLGDLDIVIIYLKNDAKESIYYTRIFEPIFWKSIDKKLRNSKDFYVEMITQIRTMDLKHLIVSQAPIEIQNDEKIKTYLCSKIDLEFR